MSFYRKATHFPFIAPTIAFATPRHLFRFVFHHQISIHRAGTKISPIEFHVRTTSHFDPATNFSGFYRPRNRDSALTMVY